MSKDQALPTEARPKRTSGTSRHSAPANMPCKHVAKGKYEILRKLGEGCFGEVFSGVDSRSGDSVAVKFEPSNKSDLATEVTILKKVGEDAQGFTRIFHYGREGNYNCLVMDRLGRSLMDLHKASGGKFNDQTAVLIAQQALRCLEVLHSCGIVHRDIKPENFMCGVGPRKHHLYLIDFGMATPYYTNGKHAPFHVVSGFSGNLRYASINSHRMYAQSRRDDLEALGHMLYFFLLGRLPWSGLPAKNWKEQNRLVMEKKETTTLPDLNDGHASAFKDYLGSCRNLGYSAKPDYEMLDGLFRQCRSRLSRHEGRVVEDHDFEWLRDPKQKEDLLPLKPRAAVAQPDEKASGLAGAPRLRGFPFARLCGGSRASDPGVPLAVTAA